MISRIAVLFPGIGYTKNHPLLYHSGKLAQQYGYKVKALEFSGFPHKLKGNREALMTSFQIAVGQAEDQLKFIDFPAYNEIVFISKSIGTVAAAIYSTKHQVPARQLYFTPLEQTFSLIEDHNGLIFHGTADSWVNTDVVLESCERKRLRLKTILGANHSLESEDVFSNLQDLQLIIEDVGRFLRKEDV
ncbi:MAG: alpha/beta hydrolase [Lachnospiraceae bacterium]|nr:alpha/beta hydrolase [Lachnospiraceae bacterium]